MAPTILGYTPSKLRSKAEKRGITVEGYTFYLKLKKRRR